MLEPWSGRRHGEYLCRRVHLRRSECLVYSTAKTGSLCTCFVLYNSCEQQSVRFLHPDSLVRLLTVQNNGRVRSFGALAKLRKMTVSYVMPVKPHGTAWLPLDGFPWNLVFMYFSKLSSIFKFRWNRTRIKGTLHGDQCTFFIIPLSIRLRMRCAR